MSALQPRTARHASLVTCHVCEYLTPQHDRTTCPRCEAVLHQRKPDSIQRTWALLLAAALLYVPANVMPVMRVVSMGREQSDTIMGGVIYFLETGSWPLALLIFFASIVVPVFKLVVLSFLSLVSVHRRSHWRPEWRARLYRMTEVVGKWSHSFDPRLLWDAMEGTDG